MAFGTPVVATNDGGTPEIIISGVNGFLVDNNDIDISLDIICNLLDNPDELRALSDNAQRTVQDKFLLEYMVANYLKLYGDLLSIGKQK